MNTDPTHAPDATRSCSPQFFYAPYFGREFMRAQYEAGLRPCEVHHAITHEGREWLLYFADEDLIFFRDRAHNTLEWTWFLRAPHITEGALQWTGTEWENARRTAQAGRCVVCRPGGRYGQSVFGLLFALDGTGCYYDGERALDFTWDWKQTDLTSPEHLLTADLVDLSLFSPRSFYTYCEHIITQQLAPRCTDPYIKPGELNDKPFAFTCGSEEELTRVTTWACHTEDGLFAQQTQAQVVYWSPLQTCPRRTTLNPTHEADYNSSVPMSERLRTLCDLAYRHNTFAGWQWKYKHNKYKPPPRLSGYAPTRSKVRVHMAAPSAHERAEALLALHAWLDGKVSAKRRDLLLGLG